MCLVKLSTNVFKCENLQSYSHLNIWTFDLKTLLSDVCRKPLGCLRKQQHQHPYLWLLGEYSPPSKFCLSPAVKCPVPSFAKCQTMFLR